MTTLLLDTHALLWWLTGDRRLPASSRDRIADPQNRVMVSAVSAWEVAVKSAIGKLEAPADLIGVAEESGLAWIPVEAAEAYAAGRLPMHHRDPFDRLLVAQVLSRAATLVSRDETFDRYGVSRVWS